MHQVYLSPIKKLTQWLMEQVQKLDKQKTWDEISLVLMNDEGITVINREYFGHDRPTDVISFAYQPLPGRKNHVTGEVLVNIERAAEEGLQRKGINWELALYIAHGCHHLMGATDRTPAQRVRMRSREIRWLKQACSLRMLDSILIEN